MIFLYAKFLVLLIAHAKICNCCEVVDEDVGTSTVRCVSLEELLREDLTFGEVEVQALEVDCKGDEQKNAIFVDLTKFLNATSVSIHACGLEKVPDVRRLEKLQFLDLKKNKISVIPWQDLQYPHLKIDLSQNPIDCRDCRNKWLRRSSTPHDHQWDVRQIFGLPSSISYDKSFKSCTFDHCPRESIKSNTSGRLNTSLGASVDLSCRITSPNTWSSTLREEDARRAFVWPLKDETHDEANLRVTYKNGSQDLWLRIENVTSHELGFVACVCLWCHSPVFDVVEILFETNVTIDLVEDVHDTHLIVHGHPLEILNLTIVRYADNMSETHVLSNQKSSFFNDSLYVKYEQDHSYNFLKYFTVFIRECADCKTYSHIHINGDYAFEVCSPQNCAFKNGSVQSVPTVDPNGPWPTQPSPKDEHSIFKHILVVILFFILFVLVATLFSTLHIKREMIKKGWELKTRRASRNTATTEETRLEETSLVYSRSISNYIIQHVPLIERSTLELKDTIGKGAFGEVHIAEWSERNIPVAVKMLHNVQMDAEMDKEAALLAQLDHPNVVKLFGISRWDSGQVVLVLEMMNLGDLKTYLRNRTPMCNNYSQFPPALLQTELINISKQVCTGLCYIANQNIVHRDLAARNCLVSGDTDMKICSAAFRPPVTVKISDFGMSRRLYSDVEYYRMQDKKTALPVRWLPPECLSSGKFTHMSDMWSFGVTLFEIFSYGGVPFGDLSNSEVVSALITGVLPNVPSNCPQVIREIIDDCWKKEPEERINSYQALERLQSLQ